jgi:hypothetical protein
MDEQWLAAITRVFFDRTPLDPPRAQMLQITGAVASSVIGPTR